jgi:hypothetical protein
MNDSRLFPVLTPRMFPPPELRYEPFGRVQVRPCCFFMGIRRPTSSGTKLPAAWRNGSPSSLPTCEAMATRVSRTEARDTSTTHFVQWLRTNLRSCASWAISGFMLVLTTEEPERHTDFA